MKIDADLAAAAPAETWREMLAVHPRGWSRTEGDCFAGISGAQAPTLNGVWAYGAEPQVEVVAALLEEVAASGLPHCLQVRPAAAERIGDLAEERGMTREETMPLMILTEPTAGSPAPAELVIRQLGADEAALHAELLAAGFEAPVEIFEELVCPELLAADGLRCYVGEVAGEPVVTGLGAVLGSHLGAFNIATGADHRRRGYGEALTARIVSDGLAAGAQWAWLQSSPSGYGVYKRLGFELVEDWQCWAADGG